MPPIPPAVKSKPRIVPVFCTCRLATDAVMVGNTSEQKSPLRGRKKASDGGETSPMTMQKNAPGAADQTRARQIADPFHKQTAGSRPTMTKAKKPER